MATRALLHISKKDELENWLEENGYMILAPRSVWEVIRCCKEDETGKDTVIIYQKASAKEHLSVMDKDYDLIRRFIRESKEKN